MMFSKRAPTTVINGKTSDADLVMASLGGDRDAFCEIVTRYQSLLCSLAYSAVGDFKHSEDIAQEAFVEAWKKLDTLKDPVKLKSWLCGILRFKASHFRRKEARQPVKGAAELEEHTGGGSDNTQLENDAIRDQHQTLLWQALEQMPENYREPLILFYREQRSVEHVADELDLTEDTVKQRLSRGRKLLQKAMVTFVEDTLEKTKPGAAFTMAVLISIGSISPPLKAASLSAGAIKTASFFKWAAFISVIAAFSGILSSFFGLRAGLDQSRTQKERRNVIKYTSLFFLVTIVYILGMFFLKYLSQSSGAANTFALGYNLIAQCLVIGLVACYSLLLIKMLRGMRALRAQERLFHPESFLDESGRVNSKQREYKSRLTLAGIPLFHFRFGMPEKNDKPVIGWIAGGDIAYGLVFAWGGFAVAPISVGIVSIGALSIGAVGIGLVGLGTVGIGLIGFGASAFAFKGYASFSAAGWESAFSNGFSIAKEAAVGPNAFATYVNNETAYEIAHLALFSQSYLWLLSIIAILVIIPAAWHSNKVRQRMRKP
jgi:RNA polymerase sigma factor (sigma-70 family)